MPNESQTVLIPDFVVRQVGALQLQLAAANERIAQLESLLASMAASDASSSPHGPSA